MLIPDNHESALNVTMETTLVIPGCSRLTVAVVISTDKILCISLSAFIAVADSLTLYVVIDAFLAIGWTCCKRRQAAWMRPLFSFQYLITLTYHGKSDLGTS